MDSEIARIVERAKACSVCERSSPPLPHEARPIVVGSPRSKIRIISQAPGLRAHEKGLPFYDPSGVRLRDWLGVDEACFYDPDNFAITPMGFCFPGYDDKGGDLPPREECAPLWQDRVSDALPSIELTVLVGMYAQRRYLGERMSRTLTETVRNWENYGPELIPLPHPSWRNNRWIKTHDWFAEVIGHLQKRISELLGS